MVYVKTLGGHPIEQHVSPNRGGAMSAHRGVVLHIAQGFYRGSISWQMNPDQRYADGTRVNTCSTWIVGKKLGEVAQMVDTDLIAWCQRDGSRTWLSVELVGFAPDKPTTWQVEAAAQLLAWSAGRYGHPVAVADHPGERGLGHHSMDREWLGEEWGHEACPGSGVIGAKATIVARAKEIVGGDDVELSDRVNLWDEAGNKPWRAGKTLGVTKADPDVSVAQLLQWGGEVGHLTHNRVLPALAGIAATLKVVAGQDPAAAVRAEMAKLSDTLVAAVRDAVPAANQDTVEAALRNVLGSLDEG